ncbi:MULTISPECIES: mechanosensitive ion channel family protein [Aerococcus]|uniref:Mechanosensitive ion channel family protein n=2 Tax=Aerococcus TaxID=1375 RepID=A0A178HIP2_9LACT|nr:MULTISPECIES: mechanosensitive ion channel family protein [Aerococcus]KAA9218227.1 mechanosensitive ion channel family protein [Aerococcus loyolae]KAA9264610.1 mechanosensitive ion channel family protein [Aerococcus loyolae]MCY3026055.1 mechanosensitive ion channel family protein [Aerococcus loyolae]MCY3027840.1 mechanosensitive ion channel family protein [Aerococcus loyolae]MCY3029397.1 mechanosensitive ion channel family protein [Aerococcus loyolae]
MQFISQWFTNYLGNIDLENILSQLLTTLLQLVLTVVLLYIIRRITVRLINTYFDKTARFSNNNYRSKTMKALLTNITQYVYYFLLGYSTLAILGVPVATLLAGAGIASIAVGIGAQGLVTDMVNGMFILLEHQLDVGDSVVIDQVSGIVEKIGIKTTVIRGFDGTMNFIPNRQIEVVVNNSRNPIRSEVDLSYFADTDINEFVAVIKKRLDDLAPDENLSKPPVLLGVTRNVDHQLVYRIRFFCVNGSQEDVQSKYYEELTNALREAGIEQPDSQRAVSHISVDYKHAENKNENK